MDYQNEVGVKVTTNGTVISVGNEYHDSFFDNDFYDVTIAYVSGGEVKLHNLPVLAHSIISDNLKDDLKVGKKVTLKMTIKGGNIIVNTVNGKEVA